VDLRDVYVRTVRAFQSSYYDVPIQECGERLVKVARNHSYSWYSHEMSLIHTPDIFLRETVYGMFLTARDTLQEQDFDLKVYDGWRSVELQEALFWHYMHLFTVDALGYAKYFAGCKSGKEVKAAFKQLPELEQARLKQENRKYVSWPSKDSERPSPHATGGAIDVWLYKNGKPATLGVPFDYMKESAAAFYHLKHPSTSWPEGNRAEVRRNRELLLRAMVGAGFNCYPHEIWHFNYGNQMSALVNNEVACYGYIEQ
jgi:zinc D-Ala-D-Ala dipeptidase